MEIIDKSIKALEKVYAKLEEKVGKKIAQSIAMGILVIATAAIVLLAWVVRREVNYYFSYGSQVEQSIEDRLIPLEKRISMLEKQVKKLQNER